MNRLKQQIEVVYIRAGYGFSVTDLEIRGKLHQRDKPGLAAVYYFVTARNTEQVFVGNALCRFISGKTFADPAMDFEEFGSLGKRRLNIGACIYAVPELRNSNDLHRRMRKRPGNLGLEFWWLPPWADYE